MSAKKISDTDKDLIALGAELGATLGSEKGAAVQPSESSENLRLIIRDEVREKCKDCERTRNMEQRMQKLENEGQETKAFINQYIGEKRYVRYLMPMLIGFMSSLAGALISALVRGGHLVK